MASFSRPCNLSAKSQSKFMFYLSPQDARAAASIWPLLPARLDAASRRMTQRPAGPSRGPRASPIERRFLFR